jgi:hypothetical protein
MSDVLSSLERLLGVDESSPITSSTEEALRGVAAVRQALSLLSAPKSPQEAYLLPLAPGLLVFCRPDVRKVCLPPTLRSSSVGSGGSAWLPLAAAQAHLGSHEAALEAERERALERWASEESSEGAVAQRCLRRAEAKAALERFLGVTSVQAHGENVVEVREENGESVMYITEFEEEGEVKPPAAPAAAASQAAQPWMDPQRERVLMKRLAYLELLSQGRQGEWEDPEGRDPLPPPPPPTPPTAAAKLPLPQQQQQQQQSQQQQSQQQSQHPKQSPVPPRAAPAEEGGAQPTAPPPPMSLFKQRMLAQKGAGSS